MTTVAAGGRDRFLGPHACAMQEVRGALATVEELDAQQLGAALRRYGVRAPETGNELSTPFPFNLMFRTSIGPKGDAIGYLRPETAQGIFVDFKCATAWAVVIYFTMGGPAVGMCVHCSVESFNAKFGDQASWGFSKATDLYRRFFQSALDACS